MSHHKFNNICVYCGCADNVNPLYYRAAAAWGEYLAKHGIRVVYGGGKTGLMGAVADGALDAGGEVIGVICEDFNTPTLRHDRLTALEVVENIHVRKARMSGLADAFVALPGGFGTFDELFETLTWAQIGLHQKPVGVLNVNAYFDPLKSLVDHALGDGFIYPEHRGLLISADNPAELLASLENFILPGNLERWMTREE